MVALLHEGDGRLGVETVGEGQDGRLPQPGGLHQLPPVGKESPLPQTKGLPESLAALGAGLGQGGDAGP